MIRQKFLTVLLWFKDHFRFLVEVVIRLSVGIREERSKPDVSSDERRENHDE